MRRISVFGATGSIGQSTLDLIRRQPGAYQVVALSGGRNIARLAADAREFDAEIAVTAYDSELEPLREALSGSGIAAAAGEHALIEAATRPADWIMSAIVGAAGLAPGFAALKQGTTLALANKESLVTAGPLLLAAARQSGATILPVDSEHSAIFQALQGEDSATVERVIITASGGALRDWPLKKLHTATAEEAARHPNWDMGQRITIDSASMFNKAMEVIETKEYFGFAPEQIEVLIHPQSLVHALVGFNDGGLMSHIGPADMRHAIGYALNWPKRGPVPVERLDLAQLSDLSFSHPDPVRYPALGIARAVMQTGGMAGAIFNAAKEKALDGFIEGHIGFMQMSGVVDATLDALSGDAAVLNAAMTLENVCKTDHLSRQQAGRIIRALAA